jgi:hypothetical protein
MQIRSNIDRPRNMPEILDLLAPMARDIITPDKEEKRREKRVRTKCRMTMSKRERIRDRLGEGHSIKE